MIVSSLDNIYHLSFLHYHLILRFYGKIPIKTTYCGADGLYGLFHRRLGDVLYVARIVAAGYCYSADYGTGVGRELIGTRTGEYGSGSGAPTIVAGIGTS